MSGIRAECIITGVTVRDPNDLGFAGDLFRLGDVYIVNANASSWDNSVDWRDPELKWIQPIGGFERRGVWVFQKEDCFISPAALDYMRNGQ